MKKSILFLLIFILTNIFALQSMAQSLSLQYGIEKDNSFYESTFDMHKKDKYGRNFLLVNYYFNASGNKSMNGVFFDFSRYVTLPLFK